MFYRLPHFHHLATTALVKLKLSGEDTQNNNGSGASNGGMIAGVVVAVVAILVSQIVYFHVS